MLSGTFHADMRFEENDWRSKGGMLGNLNLFLTLFGPDYFPRNLAAVDELKHLAALYGKTLPQFALNWTLSHPVVSTALVGFREPAEVTENLGALSWSLAGPDRAETDAVLVRHQCVTVPPGLPGGLRRRKSCACKERSASSLPPLRAWDAPARCGSRVKAPQSRLSTSTQPASMRLLPRSRRPAARRSGSPGT